MGLRMVRTGLATVALGLLAFDIAGAGPGLNSALATEMIADVDVSPVTSVRKALSLTIGIRNGQGRADGRNAW